MKIISQLKLCLFLFFLFGFTTLDELPPVSEGIVPADSFIWHDLVTPNMDRSMEFYTAVFGWTFKEVNTKGLRVATIYSGTTPIAGVIEVPRANTSVWIKAIPVSNLKDRISLAEKSGGRVLLPPADIPGRGTQVIMEGKSGEEFSFVGNLSSDLSAAGSNAENQWLWSELWADDPEGARSFYENVFKVNTESTDNGGQPYWVFQSGESKLAGMIKNPLTNQGTQWVPYVKAGNTNAVVDKAREAGAFIVLEPNASVREGKVSVFQDPLGALICVQSE